MLALDIVHPFLDLPGKCHTFFFQVHIWSNPFCSSRYRLVESFNIKLGQSIFHYLCEQFSICFIKIHTRNIHFKQWAFEFTLFLFGNSNSWIGKFIVYRLWKHVNKRIWNSLTGINFLSKKWGSVKTNMCKLNIIFAA